MVASTRIGALRYDVVADTSKFEKSMHATRTELRQSQKVLRDTQTPMEKFEKEVEKLGNLQRKGLISARQYTKAVERQKDALKKAEAQAAKTRKSYGLLGKGFSTMAKNLAGLVTAGAAIRTIQQQFERIDEIVKQARKLGMVTDELIGLRLAAAEYSGMEAPQVDMALQRMTRRVSEAAAGTGEAVKAIKELGLSAERLNQLGPAQAFQEIADAMGSFTEQDQLRIAFKLFDSEGAALVNTLKAGSDGIDAMMQKAKELGLTFSEVEAKEIEAANDALHEMNKSIEGLARSVATFLGPAVKEAADYVKSLVNDFAELRDELERWQRQRDQGTVENVSPTVTTASDLAEARVPAASYSGPAGQAMNALADEMRDHMIELRLQEQRQAGLIEDIDKNLREMTRAQLGAEDRFLEAERERAEADREQTEVLQGISDKLPVDTGV